MKQWKRYVLSVAALAALAAGLSPLVEARLSSAQWSPRPEAQFPVDAKITTPKQEWGHSLGDDYFLANYQQLMAYWKKLDGESDRIQVVQIGETALKRPHLMAIVTSPGNHKQLERYREISRRLAFAEGLTDDDARALAREGKAVVCRLLAARHGSIAMVGDGVTDVAARAGRAYIVGFGGVVYREAVAMGADCYVTDAALTATLEPLLSDEERSVLGLT